jgi:hypothetical protein
MLPFLFLVMAASLRIHEVDSRFPKKQKKKQKKISALRKLLRRESNNLRSGLSSFHFRDSCLKNRRKNEEQVNFSAKANGGIWRVACFAGTPTQIQLIHSP